MEGTAVWRVGWVLAFSGLALACRQQPEAASVPSAAPVVTQERPAAPAPPARPSGPTGSVEGTVWLEGDPPEPQPLKRGADPVCARSEAKDDVVLAPGGRLANVVVRVVDGPAGAAPAAPVVVDLLGCIYRPRIQAAMRGQEILIRNSDGTLHNVHAYEGSKTWFNQAQPPKAPEIKKPLDREGVVKLRCDVHPWMVAYVVLSEGPFFATTGAEGSFRLDGLPEGNYTLEAWHERFGRKTVPVTVKGAEVTSARFTYSVEDRG